MRSNGLYGYRDQVSCVEVRLERGRITFGVEFSQC